MRQRNAWDSVKLILKYAPVGMTFLLIVHCVLLIHGIDSVTLRFVCGAGFWCTLTMYYLSCACSFCWAHRLCIVYCGVMNFCIEFDKYNLFDSLIHVDANVIRVIMFVLGIITLYCVIRKIINGTIIRNK